MTNNKEINKDFSFSFKKNNIDDLFQNLTENPVGLEKKDFRLTLSTLYQIFEDEFEATFNQANTILRATDFKFLLDGPKPEVFVYPMNNFDFYLKSKGSLYRFSSTTIKIEEDGQLVEKEGYKVPIDIIWEYFTNFDTVIDNDALTASFAAINKLTQFILKAVQKLYFLPKVMFTDNFFTLKYELFSVTEALQDSMHAMYSLNFDAYADKKNAIDALIDSYLNYIVFKFLHIKISKFKELKAAQYFTKPLNNKRYVRSNDIGMAISEWLDEIYIGKYEIAPQLDIKKISEDNFELTISIKATSKKANFEPIQLADMYNMDTIFELNGAYVVSMVEKQINYALRYFPELEKMFEDESNLKMKLTLNDVYKIIAHISYYLTKAGIVVNLPDNLDNIIVPRASINAKIKASRESEVYEILNGTNSSISLSSIFDFEYQVAIGDEKISVEEFEKLTKDANGLVCYKNVYILVDPAENQALIDKLKHPKIDKITKMQMLHSAFSGQLNEYEFDYDEAFANIIKDITKVKEVTVPTSLIGTLRPYQENGLKWLYTNTTKGFGSCMADDMGLGKTIQVITLILKLKEENKLKQPALVICPTTLLGNWRKELGMFAPSLKVSVYHGLDRKLDTKADIIITTFAILRIDIEEIKKTNWSMLIVDEAQNIKNPDTSQTLAVKSLKSDIKIAMTGTPVENKLTELWSIFDFINKGYLGSIKDFQKSYATPIERFKQVSRADKLKLSISPFVLRRLKTDKTIINDLPEKMVIDDYCYLSKSQAALYEKTLNDLMGQISTIKGINRRGMIFKLITALKQICNHPYQYLKNGEMTKDNSGKCEKFISLLGSIMDNDEKTIVFTQYKEMGTILCDIIQKELNTEPLFFHGSLNPSQREALLTRFDEDEEAKVMILSLKAGGTGLNLTTATNVIHYDLWWNPAVEDQATDRSYRIGQDKNVMVHRLVTLGTFEEKIDEMIKQKKELVNLAVFEGEKTITELTDEEIYKIFTLSA
ncbi:MAG: DEAD/DEAH box helicase [Candidatus Gastranaerophilales bacterium]|nr:DEAD/DEAH box helicase [Candidatus Gastranaerophilales bacterium]